MFRKEPLNYLLIPNCSGRLEKQRLDRAKKELKQRKIKKILMMMGKDSEEDILYLGKILKKGDSIGFDTFPLHFKEYKEIIKKAERERKFPKGVNIEGIITNQTFKEFIYGILGLGNERLEKRKLDYQINRKRKLSQRLKNIAKRIININN